MQRRWPQYLIVGFMAFFAALFLGTFAHYQTYARNNYHIPECKEAYLFADYTFARQSKLTAAVLVNPKLARAATILHMYSQDTLEEVSMLEELYDYATADDKQFFGVFGDGATTTVIIKTIPGKDDSEEPLYCVVSKENIPLETLRQSKELAIAVRYARVPTIPVAPEGPIVSWGPFWN